MPLAWALAVRGVQRWTAVQSAAAADKPCDAGLNRTGLRCYKAPVHTGIVRGRAAGCRLPIADHALMPAGRKTVLRPRQLEAYGSPAHSSKLARFHPHPGQHQPVHWLGYPGQFRARVRRDAAGGAGRHGGLSPVRARGLAASCGVFRVIWRPGLGVRRVVFLHEGCRLHAFGPLAFATVWVLWALRGQFSVGRSGRRGHGVSRG